MVSRGEAKARTAKRAEARVTVPRVTALRVDARERRRSQLISATIKCIARNGLAGVTLQDVTREADSSLGIVNLHFDTKENLLVETLRTLAEEYRSGWTAILNGGGSPSERLGALVSFDFSARVVDRGKLAVWFAFWGETKARPTYRGICADVDARVDEELRALCEAIVGEGRYQGVDPRVVATTYSALANGLWLDLLVNPHHIDRTRARAHCITYLAGVFPRHFRAES
jgi:TetR/AcrR family transcriptional regulator, transcriptional repressor of bet genes